MLPQSTVGGSPHLAMKKALMSDLVQTGPADP